MAKRSLYSTDLRQWSSFTSSWPTTTLFDINLKLDDDDDEDNGDDDDDDDDNDDDDDDDDIKDYDLGILLRL